MKNGSRSRVVAAAEEKFDEDGKPLEAGKLLPVYMYRHGRKLPVTSFRVNY